jgi:hypothetical protein
MLRANKKVRHPVHARRPVHKRRHHPAKLRLVQVPPKPKETTQEDALAKAVAKARRQRRMSLAFVARAARVPERIVEAIEDGKLLRYIADEPLVRVLKYLKLLP